MEVNFKEINKLVDQGYITKTHHANDTDVVILNYTAKCTYDRAWNEYTLQCRGLIVNEKTGEVLARGFKKFFNYGEETGLDTVHAPGNPEITVKHDGSLGILYRMNGELLWSTRGRFDSEQSAVANRIWKEKYSNVKIPNNLTLLAEIISPETRVVVDYKGKEDLILVGVTDRYNGQDYNYDEMKMIGEAVGMPVTEKVEGTLQEILEVASTLDHNNEGFVLRWDNGYRLKIKGDKYVEIHKLLYGLSDKQLASLWSSGMLENYTMSVPEEFRKDIEVKAEKLTKACEDIVRHVNEIYRAIPIFRVRKNFAWEIEHNVQCRTFVKSLLFMRYDKEDQFEKVVMAYVATNYLEYI